MAPWLEMVGAALVQQACLAPSDWKGPTIALGPGMKAVTYLRPRRLVIRTAIRGSVLHLYPGLVPDSLGALTTRGTARG
jgi:hypothetical protein